MINKKKMIVLLFVAGFMMFLFAGCAPQAAVSTGFMDQPKTDLSAEQAEGAAEEIREQAELSLGAAETVYVYAYSDMLKQYGVEVEDMDAETYFLRYAKMIQSGATIMPSEEVIILAMEEIGVDGENGVFDMERFSAGMSAEISKVPKQMQAMIAAYDAGIQGENIYLKVAHEAYLAYKG